MAGNGATPSLPRVPAKVSSPNPQRTLTLGGGMRAHAPKPSFNEIQTTDESAGKPPFAPDLTRDNHERLGIVKPDHRVRVPSPCRPRSRSPYRSREKHCQRPAHLASL